MLEGYKKYCHENNLNFKILEYDSLEANGKIGCRSSKIEIYGDGVYDYFKYESGVHKVQRVPVTETKGRVHSSTCQVAVMKTATSDLSEIDLDERDLKYEFMRAGGAGGQHVNKTESACRITHLPTGISVAIQDSREQRMNKLKALSILRERVNKLRTTNFNEKINSERKNQTGTGNLSEKIRTYNFPDSRITDHRLGVTKFGIEKWFEGSLISEFNTLSKEKEKNEKLMSIINRRKNN
jgi:peptide chain release factor 1